jgi:ubiquinone/menaquinone biosynthesis C-methylase UbiE
MIILTLIRSLGAAFFFLSFAQAVSCQSVGVKPHEQGWQEYAGKPYFWHNLHDWLYDIHAFSRVAVRQHIKKMGYRSYLDVAAGVGTDYVGFKYDSIEIEYQGVDITPKMVSFAQSNGVPMIQASIEQLPFGDSSFDVSCARHILEHLPSYQRALKEMIRVSRREVIIVFFMPPHAQDQDSLKASFFHGHLIYHHAYSKKKLLQFLDSCSAVLSCTWQVPVASEIILHIHLKKNEACLTSKDSNS